MNQLETSSPVPAMPPMPPAMAAESSVIAVDEIIIEELQALLALFDLQLELVTDGHAIPGSYWGESEAGLIGNNLYARIDTPVHSVLHEASHYICMDNRRRAALHRDAGGDHDEENAVCYLQIVLAEHLSGYCSDRMMFDMDAWGYTFRLGSAHAWFAHEAEDARQWLIKHQLIQLDDTPTWQIRP